MPPEERVAAEGFCGEVPITKRGRFLERKRQRWQVLATMVTVLAWLVFLVLFVLLWAPSLSLFQNIVIFFASLVAAITVGAGAYAMRYGWEPSRTKWTERVGAAVEEAVKESVGPAVEEAVKEKLGERGIESERE